jgi:glutaredoxin
MLGRSTKQPPAPNAKEKFNQHDSKGAIAMAAKKRIEVFSAGCSTCKETIELVKRIAGSHEVVIHDMQKSEVASKAKNYVVRSVPAVVIDGKLAGCCAGRGPDEHVLRSALA